MKNQFSASFFKKKGVCSQRLSDLHLFQKILKIRFKEIALLNLALTHRSYQNESASTADNERLEFLGDSVLGLVACDLLYQHFPDQKEGYLAKIKSYVVSEEILAEIAASFQVSRYLLLGKGEILTDGCHKKAILADAMEAIIGAFYLDSGFAAAESFVRSFIAPEIIKVKENRHHKDYKTLLQEYAQKYLKASPRYTLVAQTGPDHDPTFKMALHLKNETLAQAEGKTKKEAQQLAARLACGILQQRNPDSFNAFSHSIQSV